ncbi:MAG: response regulator transcription factor [Clostridiales bacterium]|jgi:two-component system secretion system response regulator SalR|nr:response regulator transcription factor [Clostridiales bacterium]
MKIVLFDDHTLFGISLQKVLIGNENIDKFYFINSLDDLETILDSEREAILLLDINLNKLGIDDSFEVASEIMLVHPTIRLAFLSGYDRPMYRKRANSMGAKGFFSKDISVDELIRGLKIIESGGNVFKREDRANNERCTPTEILILKLSAKGMSRNEIAEYIHISNRTVGTHLTNIFQKLEVKNITEAISVALEYGYIPPIF